MAKKEIGRPQTAHIAPFGLRLQPDLKEQVEAAARSAGRSMNAEIAARLEQSFSASNSPSGAIAWGLANAEFRVLHKEIELRGAVYRSAHLATELSKILEGAAGACKKILGSVGYDEALDMARAAVRAAADIDASWDDDHVFTQAKSARARLAELTRSVASDGSKENPLLTLAKRLEAGGAHDDH